MDFVNRHKNDGIIDFFMLSENSNTDLHIIDEYCDRDINWAAVTMNIFNKVNLYVRDYIYEFITKHKDKLLMDILLNHSPIAHRFSIDDKYIEQCEHAKKMLEMYDNNINWLINNLLLEYYISMNNLYGGWDSTSKDGLLNEYMIRKHQDEVNWEYIFKYQKYISEEFKKEFAYKLTK